MDGILVINKEKEYTSFDVVAKTRKILNTKKVGHTGTLDPNATGVLPLLIGKGTKLSKYLIDHDKVYRATLKLGIKTDTADIEGSIIEKKEIDLKKFKKHDIEEILREFVGKQTQIPPMYSAIKINGKKLYEYARKNEIINVEPRNIEIYNIALENVNYTENEIIYTVECSKGTYIRTLCEDIAKKFNTVGYMKDLERIKVGKFNINDSITITKLEKDLKDENELDKEKYLKNKMITIEEFFESKEKIVLNKKNLELFLNGVKLDNEFNDNLYRIYDEENNFIGIGKIQKKLLKRELIINEV